MNTKAITTHTISLKIVAIVNTINYHFPMRSFAVYRLLSTAIILTQIIVSNAGAVRYDEGDWVSFSEFRYVTSVTADRHVVYFGTTGGVIRYDTFSETWLDPLTVVNGLPSNYVRALVFDSQYNELWIATDRGIGKYNITFESWYTDSNFPTGKIINNWRSSRFPGLFMPFEYTYNDGYITDPDMQQFQITVGYDDGDFYRMYIGTWGMGIGVIDTHHNRLELLAYGPYDSNISRVVKIGDDLWMGTDFSTSDRAITRFDKGRNEWDYYKSRFVYGLDNTEITSGVNAGDYTWLGTTTGLLRIDRGSTFKTYSSFANLPSPEIYSLAEYGGYLYVGTDNGLAVLSTGGAVPDSAFREPLPDDLYLRGHIIYDLYVFKDVLYIATDNKVFSYNAVLNQFRDLDTPNGDLAYGVYDIFGDGVNIYFGARFGVVMVNPDTDNLLVASEHRYMDVWRINEVYADSKYIWAATDIGLWKYRKRDQYTYLYTVNDGLPVNEINSLIADGDYFWLGTSEGLIRFFWNDPGRGD